MEFISKPTPFWTDLSETSLFITVRLLLSNGNNVPAATPDALGPENAGYKAAGFVQNPEATLFKDFIFRINQTNLNSTNNCYGMIGYLQNLLFFSSDAKNSKLELGGW